MNSVDDFLHRLTGDPSYARKLLDLVEGLGRGETMRRAAQRAAISEAELDRVLDVIGETLAAASQGISKAERSGANRALNTAIIHADGASRGNPGEAACAAVVYDEHSTEVLSRAQRLGRATNNVAEYRGVLLALELARELGAANIVLRLDSELIVNQLNGSYKVRHAGLKPLYEKARELLSSFARTSIEHVPREKNTRADDLANAALDAGG